MHFLGKAILSLVCAAGLTGLALGQGRGGRQGPSGGSHFQSPANVGHAVSPERPAHRSSGPRSPHQSRQGHRGGNDFVRPHGVSGTGRHSGGVVPTSRRPRGVAPANRHPRAKPGLAPHGPHGLHKARSLDLATNEELVGILGSGDVGPKTSAALDTVLSGGHLTPGQASYLQGAIEKNTKLSAAQKGAIATALQNDAETKGKHNGKNGNGNGEDGHRHGHHRHNDGTAGGDGSYAGDGGADGGGPPADAGGESADQSGGVPAGTSDQEEGPTAPEYGVRITKLLEGTAAQQGMRLGDVILSINGVPTPTFQALADAVSQSGSQAEVIFFNPETAQRESIELYPDNGRIGVGGESVPVD